MNDTNNKMTRDNKSTFWSKDTLFPRPRLVILLVLMCIAATCLTSYMNNTLPVYRELRGEIADLSGQIDENNINVKQLDYKIDTLLLIPTKDKYSISQLEQQIKTIHAEQERSRESMKNLREDVRTWYSEYQKSTDKHIIFYSLFITILIAVSGVLIPILLKSEREEFAKAKIAEITKDINLLRDSIKETKIIAEEVDISEKLGRISREKEFDIQMELFNKLIELNPDNYKVYFHRGLVYSHRKMTNESISEYSKSINLKADNSPTYNNRGGEYMKLGMYPEAIADYTESIKLRPLSTTMYCNRALAYLNKCMYAEALLDCTQAVKLNYKYSRAYKLRIALYGKLAELETVELEKQKYLELAKEDIKVYDKLLKERGENLKQ